MDVLETPSTPGKHDWARRPAAVVLVLLGVALMLATARFEWPLLKFLGKLWETITWSHSPSQPTPPGPVTICFFLFPLMLMIIGVLALVGFGGGVILFLCAKRLALESDFRAPFLLLLALNLLLLPFGTALAQAVFFRAGKFVIPSARQWLEFLDRDGVIVLAPTLLIGLAITFLCFVREPRRSVQARQANAPPLPVAR